MMTKNQLRPIILAWLNDQPIQWRYNEHTPWEDEDLTVSECLPPVPNFNGLDWRIKPKKKLRPWKPEEVPVGAIIRDLKFSSVTQLILSSIGGYVQVVSRNPVELCEHSLEILVGRHYSTDGGVTWKPCGVEE